jgi:hypothetical protein
LALGDAFGDLEHKYSGEQELQALWPSCRGPAHASCLVMKKL